MGFPLQVNKNNNVRTRSTDNLKNFLKNMPHCSAFNCHNQSRNNNNISFHALPSDENTKKAWIQKIGRDVSNLPKEKNIFLCSDHFSEECFDKSHDMRMKLAPPTKKKISRMLVQGSIPTIFSHKPVPNPRRSSTNRTKNAENAEVLLRGKSQGRVDNYYF